MVVLSTSSCAKGINIRTPRKTDFSKRENTCFSHPWYAKNHHLGKKNRLANWRPIPLADVCSLRAHGPKAIVVVVVPYLTPSFGLPSLPQTHPPPLFQPNSFGHDGHARWESTRKGVRAIRQASLAARGLETLKHEHDIPQLV